MNEDKIISQIERLVVQSRLSLIAGMLVTDRADRASQIAHALARLRPGAYLVGTGPSTVGIIPLTVDEVVLGRAATPLEEPTDVIVDYHVADTLYLAPHEVSRAHAKIVRHQQSSGAMYQIVDLGSTCGTFVNGKATAKESGTELKSGDAISLGPSHVSTYVFVYIHAA